jgi:hypothetical protein
MNMWRVGEDMGSKEMDRCPLTPPLIAATRSPSPEAELTETLRRFSEVIPTVSETHSVSFGYTSLVRYSYYIPRQY